MPNDRLFHKRAGHSAKVNSLTDFEELAWRYYIESADDFGVMRFSAITLQADHDRMARKPAKTVQRALARVEAVGLIKTFEHQKRTYCYQPDWQDWQKIDYPRATISPKPPTDELSDKTRELFAKHPGGWSKKKPRTCADDSQNIPQTFPEHSQNIPRTVPEGFGKPSGEIAPKPLAVSHKPLAVSREPVSASAPNARSKLPVFRGQRLVVFDWMLDDLARMLGKHNDAFDLHAWFYALDQQAVDSDTVIPQRDGGKWLQDRTMEEAVRRGLPLSAGQTHNPKTAGNLAAAARFVARGQ